MDMYGCVRMLLNNGVKGDKIILARRELEEGEPTCFNNPQVRNQLDIWGYLNEIKLKKNNVVPASCRGAIKGP